MKKILLMLLVVSNIAFSGEWILHGLKENLKHRSSVVPGTYLMTKHKSIPVYSQPTTGSAPIETVNWLQKREFLGEVKGKRTNGSKVWYKTRTANGAIGYIPSAYAKKRQIRYQTIMHKLNELDNFINGSLNQGKTVGSIEAYVPGSKETGPADMYGNRGEQSARATFGGGFRYLQDSRLIAINSNNGGEASVNVPDSNQTYTINSSNISKQVLRGSVNRVIVIDTEYQNLTTYIRKGGHWELTSAVYAATGRNDGGDFYDTPKGFFMVHNTVPNVVSIDDKTGETSYSRYGVRFSGGGYIHGIPLTASERSGGNAGNLIAERQNALGTHGYTHKCVRNPQAHAKWLHSSFVGNASRNKVAVIVI